MTFTKAFKLSLHSAPNHVLQFSPDGNYLLSGGFDGIIYVWSPNTLIKHRYSPKQGPISGLKWVTCFQSQGADFFVSAGYNGTLVLWRKSPGQDQFEPVAHETVLPCAIESIDIYEDTIAVAGGSQLRILRMHPTSQPVFQEPYSQRNMEGISSNTVLTDPQGIYRVVLFFNQGRSLMLGILDSAVCISWDLASGRRHWRTHLQGRIGSLAYDEATKALLVWNLRDGIDIYGTSTDSTTGPIFYGKLPVNIQVNRAMQVAFGRQDEVITGTDMGYVHIWSLSKRCLVHRLDVNLLRSVAVQTVAYCRRGDVDFIACGTTNPHESSSTIVWTTGPISRFPVLESLIKATHYWRIPVGFGIALAVALTSNTPTAKIFATYAVYQTLVHSDHNLALWVQERVLKYVMRVIAIVTRLDFVLFLAFVAWQYISFFGLAYPRWPW